MVVVDAGAATRDGELEQAVSTRSIGSASFMPHHATQQPNQPQNQAQTLAVRDATDLAEQRDSVADRKPTSTLNL